MARARAPRRVVALAGLTVGVLVAAGVGGWAARERVEVEGLDEVELDLDGSNALRGWLRLETDAPATLEVEVRGPDGTQVIRTNGEPAEEHEVPILGLRADRDHEVRVRAVGADGEVVADGGVGTLSTGELPDVLPSVDVEVSDPAGMTPGLTLFNLLIRPGPGEQVEQEGGLVAVDPEGEVVWYHLEELPIQDARRLDDGQLLFISDETGARRITVTGEATGEWRGSSTGTDPDRYGEGLDPDEVVEVDTHSMHHEIWEMEDGSFVTLSRVDRVVAYDEPLCDDSEAADDGTAEELVIGDAIVRFDPDTGAVLEEWTSFDAIAPQDDPRLTVGDYCSATYMYRHYPEGSLPRDWTHANAVVLYDDDTWLVSNRHTDEVIAISREDGSRKWSLGPDQELELTEGDWFWHQHAPEVQDDGSILIYDNGNDRLDADEPYSRAVRYEVDLAAGTATQVWESRTDPDVYAPFVGDADRLDGTVLTTHGGLTEPCEQEGADEDATRLIGRIQEVDEATGDVVLDLTTRDPDGGCTGYGMYRAERLDTLYPPEFTVDDVG